MPKRSPCVQMASAQPREEALISAGRASWSASKSSPAVLGRAEQIRPFRRPDTADGRRRRTVLRVGRARRGPDEKRSGITTSPAAASGAPQRLTASEPGPADVGSSTSPARPHAIAASAHAGELAHHFGRAVASAHRGRSHPRASPAAGPAGTSDSTRAGERTVVTGSQAHARSADRRGARRSRRTR